MHPWSWETVCGQIWSLWCRGWYHLLTAGCRWPETSPCAFFSLRLSPADRNYDIGNQQLLLVKLALEEWCHWLEGTKSPFLVWTNRKNLEYICSSIRLNSRQAWWSLFFTRFNLSFLSARLSQISNQMPYLTILWQGKRPPLTLTPSSLQPVLWRLSPRSG